MSSKTIHYLGNGLTLLVGLFLLLDSGMKVAGATVSIDTMRQLGFSAETTRVLGLILLASTLLFLIARTRLLGAILVTAYLGGAIAIHTQQGAPLFSHTLFGFYVGLLLWGSFWLKSASLRAMAPIARP
jgi:hypothetical protein